MMNLRTHTPLLLALLATILWFALLGERDLFEPDEGRYAQIPREMVLSGDWVTPRLHGFKYFEKPPLQYWATATLFTLFGESATSARLWTALCGLLGALWVWWLGHRLYGGVTGQYGFIVTLGGVLYVGCGHLVTLDMTLALFLALGIGSLALAQSQREQPAQVRRWMLLGWAALALATLTKGPIGLVLPGLAVLVYSLWQRDWVLWRRLYLLEGLALFLAITVPWFALVSYRNPEFARFFFIHEHLERFTSTVHHREGPPLYFLGVLLIGALPWTGSLLAALLRPGFPWRPGSPGTFDAERFLWVFVVVVLVFFSASHSKLIPYILPVAPVLGLLIGRRLAQRGPHPADAWLIGLMGVGLLVAGLGAQHFANHKIPVPLWLAYRPWILAAGGLLIAAGLLPRPARLRTAQVWGVGLLALLGFRLLLLGGQALAPSFSSRTLAEAIRAHSGPEVPVFILRDHDPNSLPFYLKRPITLVGFKSELTLGIDLEPQGWIDSEASFLERWRTLDQGVAVLDPEQYGRYAAQGVPMRVIYRDPRQVTVIK